MRCSVSCGMSASIRKNADILLFGGVLQNNTLLQNFYQNDVFCNTKNHGTGISEIGVNFLFFLHFPGILDENWCQQRRNLLF